jgi:osmotically-inducible protein OsmY
MAQTDPSVTPPIVDPAARTAAGSDAGSAPSASPDKVAPRATRVARGTFAFAAIVVVLALATVYLISTQGIVAAARDAYGVARAVKNTTVAVKDTSVDAATTAKAKTALALSKRVSALQVNVDTKDGVATLSGSVPTEDSRDIAGQIVGDTSGVRDVRNALTVDPRLKSEPDREWLTARVNELETQTALAETLQDAPDLTGARVHVRMASGVATLVGTVATTVQKVRAVELARAFPGVQEVNDRLALP